MLSMIISLITMGIVLEVEGSVFYYHWQWFGLRAIFSNALQTCSRNNHFVEEPDANMKRVDEELVLFVKSTNASD